MISFVSDHLPIMITLLCLLVGISLFLYGMVWVVIAIESKSWATETGRIIFSEVVTKRCSTLDGIFLAKYQPSICFSYTIDDVEYFSDRMKIIYNYSTNFSSRAYRKVNKYPKNQSVTVYYSINRPNEAVLEPGITYEIVGLVVIGLVITVVSTLFANEFIFDALSSK